MVTLGILLHQLDDNLARSITQALSLKAKQHDLRLVYLPSRRLHSPKQFNRQFNILFDIGAQLPFDGILSMTNSFQAGAYDDEIIQLFNRFQPLPLLSCNFAADNIPAVIIDNRMGAAQLFSHLFDDHKFQHVAYMRGPDGHFDEQERFDSYLTALRERDIPLDPSLIVQGNFDAASGRRALEILLERNVHFDVLVCANDEMAMAAMTLATERHLHVPGDFAICGFDNLRTINGEAPPITSVTLPTENQVHLAVETLLKQIRGESISMVAKVPTNLVVRHSCGCSGVRDTTHNWVPKAGSYHRSQNLQYRERIIRSLMLSPNRESVYKSYLLFLEHCIKQFEKNTWMDSAIGEFALECLVHEGEVTSLQTLVLRMQQSLFDICPDLIGGANPIHLLACAVQMQKWQIAINNKAHQYFLTKQDENNRNREYFRDWIKTRPELQSPESLKLHIEKLFRHLGIKHAYLGQYLNRVDYQLFGIDMPSELQQWMAFGEDGIQDNSKADLLSVKHLLKLTDTPDQNACEWVILPIFQQHTHFGVMVLCLHEKISIPIEWIRSEVSRLMINAIITEELREQGDRLQTRLEMSATHNERLVRLAERDELTGLFNRRGFFHRAPFWAAAQNDADMVALFIDLDNFKTINDTHGHAEGDRALVEAATLIASVFRSEDIVCRLGGDEFVVLTCITDSTYLTTIRLRLNNAFNRYNEMSGKPYNLHCSLGSYVFSSEHAQNLEVILDKADALLYEEKRRRKETKLMH